jgi:hypothetical protein
MCLFIYLVCVNGIWVSTVITVFRQAEIMSPPENATIHQEGMEVTCQKVLLLVINKATKRVAMYMGESRSYILNFKGWITTLVHWKQLPEAKWWIQLSRNCRTKNPGNPCLISTSWWFYFTLSAISEHNVEFSEGILWNEAQLKDRNQQFMWALSPSQPVVSYGWAM